MIRELIATLWDVVIHGDLRGHWLAWCQVARGEVSLESRIWSVDTQLIVAEWNRKFRKSTAARGGGAAW